jgi:DNA polymerase III subunit delta'
MPRSVEPPAASAGSAPPPRANPDLLGHDNAERELRQLLDMGRLPHAILVTGPRGIGKATLAFRLARFLLARSGADAAHGFPDSAPTGLAVDTESSVFHRVAAGSHADLLTVERAYDPRRRRLRSEIIVEDTREIASFLRLTAAEEGWRIVIVDGAEEMNRNAANAVLKILEEPPRQALLLLVSHSPGRVLPTIRSRCRRLPLAPLSRPLVLQLLFRYCPALDRREGEAIAALAEGSIGRALELADAGGLELYGTILKLLSGVPHLNIAGLYAFAEQVSRADAEEIFRVSEELLSQFLARMIAYSARGQPAGDDLIAEEVGIMERLAARADSARWAALRTQIDQDFANTDLLNLDRKQAILGAFFAIDQLAG